MGKRENQQKYYAKYKERIDAEKKAWVLANPEKRKEAVKKYKEANKEKAYQYIIDNYEWYLWNSARTRARVHNIPFSLVKEDIIIPEICPYLKVPITKIQGKGRQETNPSVDRIDSTKGYSKDNIEIISDLANRMKNSATKEQLITFAKSILERNGINLRL